MNRYIYIFIIIFLYVYSHAQVTERFEDTAWSQTKIWNGHLSDFKINTAGQLQSTGHARGVSMIYTQQRLSAVDIELWFKLGFAPSENNKLRIYVQADDTILTNANGYYLEIGDNGNTDAIKFYRQSLGKSTLIAEGLSGAVAGDPVLVRLLLQRCDDGRWTLSTDYTGGQTFREEWFVQDDVLQFNASKNIFAIQCSYTSTRSDKFFFDDIFIRPDTMSCVNGDHTSPEISQIYSTDHTVVLNFDEPIDSITSTDTENYVVSNSIGQPWKVNRISPYGVEIFFTKNFVHNTRYEIICKRIIDTAGNTISNLRGAWTHKTIQAIEPNALLITELMIDPSPVVGLPNYEYIEIFNTSDHDIDLAKIKLKFDQSVYTMDTTTLVLKPNQYMVCCESSAYDFFKNGFPVASVLHPLRRWPALRNTFGTIVITDEKDKIIHSISYEDNWYRDTQKDDGGWSLEMINPAQMCDQKYNWGASLHPAGGTPGAQNSIWDTIRYEPLRIDSLRIPDDRTIYIYTNQMVGTISTGDVTLLPGSMVQNTMVVGLHIEIRLNQNLSSGQVYTLKLMLKDCAGRSFNELTTALTKTETILKNDVVINEILFNPVSGGSDYIELYNRSKKILSLQNMVITNTANQQQRTILSSALMMPDTYWVITPNPQHIFRQYITDHPDQVISQSLPSLPDDQGQVSLWSPGNVLIDSCSYTASMQDEILNSREGVALERIDVNLPPIRSNWHSASGAERYGTPTRKNSVAVANSATSKAMFSLQQKVFTPDDDGTDDLLLLNYTLPDIGYLARIDIFTDRGQRIKRLANNLTLSRNGSLSWDGKDDTGVLMPAGIYILVIELVHLNGSHHKERLVGVLSR